MTGRRRRPWTLALLGALLSSVAFGCGPPAGAFGAWPPPIRATPEIAALERAMFERLNRDRAAAGLPPLEYDEALADVARAHSLDMRDHGFFAHESPSTGALDDRIDRAGYLAHEMRENLAVAPTVDRAQDNLLDSPGHRANILATSVTHVGVGIVKGSSESPDGLTVTQVFAHPAVLEPPQDVATGLLAAIDEARRAAGVPPLETHDLLTELAADHVDSLEDGLPESSTAEVRDAVSNALSRASDHGLGSIRVVAQLVMEAGESPPPASALEPAITHAGVAAAEGRDAKGRPRIKVLLLLGRAR